MAAPRVLLAPSPPRGARHDWCYADEPDACDLAGRAGARAGSTAELLAGGGDGISAAAAAA